MTTLSVRQILSIPVEDIFTTITLPEYTVVFDNNEVEVTTSKEIILNRYCWELFYGYVNTPITPLCSVKHILADTYYTSDSHVKILNALFRYICEYNNFISFAQKEELLKRVYYVVNLIFNSLLYKISNHLTTIDSLDYIEIVKMPEIVNIHANIKPHPDSIDKAYKDIKQTLTSIQKSSNRFIHAYKSKSVNENQSNQCIGPRGFITDIDRTVFKQPALSGFIDGLHTLYEFIIESRTAAKALNANDNHIKTSEYTSRRLQLLSMVVENVVTGDCGSTEYFHMLVLPAMLENLKGKYYLDDETNKLVVIQGNETHLINKIIKLRTALGCTLEDSSKICSTCLGEISNNFKANSNLGYTAVSYLMEKATQSILSTKHLTHSVRKSTISLDGLANKYFYVTSDGYLYFNKGVNLNNLKLVLYSNQVTKLVDVLNLTHTKISLNKIGNISTISIIDNNHKNPVSEFMSISYKDRTCILTKELLQYIKSTKLEADTRSNFVIDLSTFDKTQPIFFSPLKEKNIITFVSRLATIIETSNDKQVDPYQKLDLAFNHVIDQFKCNISIIEIIVYATTTQNVFENDYRLGRNSVHPKTEPVNIISKSRSLSQLFVYEDQVKAMYKSGFNIFNTQNRQKHLFDVLFIPHELMLNKKI